jgi:hypothetical protein
MLQAAVGDGLAFDPFAFEEDALGLSKIDVSRREIVEALVISGVVVLLDESRDLPFEITGQIVMVQQDAVLERLMPALDLALRLRMIRRVPRTCSMFFLSSHLARSAAAYDEPLSGSGDESVSGATLA